MTDEPVRDESLPEYEKMKRDGLIREILRLNGKLCDIAAKREIALRGFMDTKAALDDLRKSSTAAISDLKAEIVTLQANLNRALGYIDRVTENTEPVVEQKTIAPASRGPRLGGFTDNSYAIMSQGMADYQNAEERIGVRRKRWFDR